MDNARLTATYVEGSQDHTNGTVQIEVRYDIYSDKSSGYTTSYNSECKIEVVFGESYTYKKSGKITGSKQKTWVNVFTNRYTVKQGLGIERSCKVTCSTSGSTKIPATEYTDAITLPLVVFDQVKYVDMPIITELSTVVPKRSRGMVGTSEKFEIKKASKSRGELTHKLTYQFGWETGVIVDSWSKDEVTWDIPINLNKWIGTKTEFVGKIICTTYEDYTSIGSTEIPFTILKYREDLPEIIVSLSPDLSNVPEDVQGSEFPYLKDVTGCNVSISGVGTDETELAEFETEIQGETYTDKEFTSNILTESGEIKLTVTVVDTVGYKKIEELTINVADYEAPKVSNPECYRGTSDGGRDALGESVYLYAEVLYTSLGGRNMYSLSFHSKTRSGTYDDLVALQTENNKFKNTLPKTFQKNLTYVVEVVVTDRFGSSTSVEFDIPTAKVTFALGRGGNSVGIGKYPEFEGLEIDMPVRFNKPIEGFVRVEEIYLNKDNQRINGMWNYDLSEYSGTPIGVVGFRTNSSWSLGSLNVNDGLLNVSMDIGSSTNPFIYVYVLFV